MRLEPSITATILIHRSIHLLDIGQSGIVWCMLDYRTERKYTVVGFCSGTIAGLVAATPSSGFVPAWGALVIGIASGTICNYATKREFFLSTRFVQTLETDVTENSQVLPSHR